MATIYVECEKCGERGLDFIVSSIDIENHNTKKWIHRKCATLDEQIQSIRWDITYTKGLDKARLALRKIDLAVLIKEKERK